MIRWHMRNLGWLAVWLFLIGWASSASSAEPMVTALAHLSKTNQLIIGSTQSITVLSLPELQPIQSLNTGLDHVHDLAISPDQSKLLAVGGVPGESGTVELWNLTNFQLVGSHHLSSDVIYHTEWSVDGSSFCAAGADGVCRVVTIENHANFGLAAKRFDFAGHSQSVLSVRCLSDQTYASMGVDQTIRIWSAGDGGQTLRVLDNHVGSVLGSSLARSPNHSSANLLATVSEDRTVRLWQPALGRMLRFARLTSPAQCVCWSQDGQQLWVGCRDGQVRSIRADNAQIVHEVDARLATIYEITAIGPNQVAVGGEGGCKLVNVAVAKN